MTVGSWIDMVLYSDQGVSHPVTLAFTMLLAFAVGQTVGWIYLATSTTADYARSFVGALVVLPVIVALLMMLMTGSFMVAFGLMAVLAVVRFRNVLRDTRDTVFVLWTIVEGMAVGTQRYSMAVLGATAIATVLVYLRITSFGARRRPDGLLTVEISGDPKSGRVELNHLLHRHAQRHELTGDQSMPGQGLVLTYHLHLRDRTRSHDLRDELAQSDQLHEVSYVNRPAPPKKPARAPLD
jgi:hypothetical protein